MVLEPSRKDDMISLMYLLIYLKKGTLPWTYLLQNEIKVAYKEIQKSKLSYHKKLI